MFAKNKLQPNFTQIPNYFLDELLPDLKDGEWRCLCIIARKTYGFHKTIDHIANSQLARLTGLSERTIQRSLQSLIKKQIVIQHTKGDGKLVSSYSINLRVGDNLSPLNTGRGDKCDTTRGDKLSPTKENNTQNKIYTPAKQTLTPDKQEPTTFQATHKPGSTDDSNSEFEMLKQRLEENLNAGIDDSRKTNKRDEWFMVPDMMSYDFGNPEHIAFLNQTDEKIVVFLTKYLGDTPEENKEQRESLETDIHTFLYKFAREEKVSSALIKKLKNIAYIIDKFSLDQYIKAYDIAKKRGHHAKLSYIRRVLEKAVMPKIYDQNRKINGKLITPKNVR